MGRARAAVSLTDRLFNLDRVLIGTSATLMGLHFVAYQVGHGQSRRLDRWLFLFLLEPFLALGIAVAAPIELGSALVAFAAIIQFGWMVYWVQRAEPVASGTDTTVPRIWLTFAFLPLITVCLSIVTIEVLRVFRFSSAQGLLPTFMSLWPSQVKSLDRSSRTLFLPQEHSTAKLCSQLQRKERAVHPWLP